MASASGGVWIVVMGRQCCGGREAVSLFCFGVGMVLEPVALESEPFLFP